MNQQEIFELIRSMTGQSNVLTIPRVFIDYTGDLESALLLSQIIYWTDKSKNNGWIYKTYQEWEEEISLNEYKVRKAKNKLENMGILETKIKKANGNPVVHYRLKTDSFSESFLENLKKRTFKNLRNKPLNFSETLTKITTEITTEITTNIDDEEQQQHQQIKKIIEVFNSNIHNMTPIEFEKLNSWLEDVEYEVIIKAIEEAVTNNKRNMNYINKILNNWHSMGLKTKADVEEYMRNWNKKKEQPKSSWKEADLTGLM